MPLAYMRRAEMWTFNAKLHCSNYKWQLHVSATKLQSAGCLCEKYKRKSYTCIVHIAENDYYKISQPYV